MEKLSSCIVALYLGVLILVTAGLANAQVKQRKCVETILPSLNPCKEYLTNLLPMILPTPRCCAAAKTFSALGDSNTLCHCLKDYTPIFGTLYSKVELIPNLCGLQNLTAVANCMKPVGTNVNGLKGLNQHEALETKAKRITKSAPSPGSGHKVSKALNLPKVLETKAFRITKSAPSPGSGHKVPKALNLPKVLETKAFRITKSAPSPGSGHKVPKAPNLHKALETKAFRIAKSAPSPGSGHKVPKSPNLHKALETKAFRIAKSAPSPGSGHKVPKALILHKALETKLSGSLNPHPALAQAIRF